MKNVLNSSVVALVLITLSCGFSGAALANEAPSAPAKSLSNFWADAQSLINKCAISPYAYQGSRKAYGPLRSKCKELQLKNNKASFTLGEEYRNETFIASVEESAESDGGDLVDVTVTDSSEAVVAQLKNVLAFNDVLLALASGHVQLEEVYDPSITAQ